MFQDIYEFNGVLFVQLKKGKSIESDEVIQSVEKLLREHSSGYAFLSDFKKENSKIVRVELDELINFEKLMKGNHPKNGRSRKSRMIDSQAIQDK
ncbi:hypothetical protein [Bacillus licheniformis]|uniref:hypothetical protein n=1 Tax=Bacillus licheniformis TaxID=1402 RepID=UPI002E23799D|nr:hypothetical protein [Bacillus licheniformis]